MSPYQTSSETHNGYYRVEEEAMRLIDRSFDKLCDARNAANCYTTLCRVANLKGGDIFEVSISSLARDLHCVYRDAQKALALVEAIKLVKIERQKIPGTKENAPSIYTVIRLRPDIMSLPTDITSEGPGRDHVHDPSRSFPKNSPKNFQELPKREASPPRTRFVPPSLAEAEAEALKNGMPATEGQAFIDHHQAKGWVIGKSPMKDWRAAMRTWKRNWEKFRAGASHSNNGRQPQRFNPIGQSVAEIRGQRP